MVPLPQAQDVLTAILRQGVQTRLAPALAAEVADWIARHRDCREAAGRRPVVRNGHLPERPLTTGLGPVTVQQPRVHDRRPPEQRAQFSAAILPPSLRKTQSIEELLPWLYRKGVSTGALSEALAALLGPDATGLSATTVTRRKTLWQQADPDWRKRSLAGKPYGSVWADGVYVNLRREGGRQCLLVLLGATADGKKALSAIQDGQRESEQSWKELLLDVPARGLTREPKRAIGDGALGCWKAVRQVWSETPEQRCWVPKTAKVLDQLPKRMPPQAKELLPAIYLAASRAEADKAFAVGLRTEAAKYAKATECLAQDRTALLRCSDFAAEHGMHLRTTTVIESGFATVRLRTDTTKGSGTRGACLTLVFQLLPAAARRWRALNGSGLLADVVNGVVFGEGSKAGAA